MIATSSPPSSATAPIKLEFFVRDKTSPVTIVWHSKPHKSVVGSYLISFNRDWPGNGYAVSYKDRRDNLIDVMRKVSSLTIAERVCCEHAARQPD
jgi:hypothetical protein